MADLIVSIDQVQVGDVIAEPIVVYSDDGRDMMLCRRKSVVDARVLDLLKKHKVHQIKIVPPLDHEKKVEKPKPAPALPKPEEPPRVIPKSEVKPIFDEKLKKEAVKGIETMFSFLEGGGDNMTTAYQAVKGFEKVVKQVVEVATGDGSSFVHIHDLKSHDEYTYHHSLSVSLLSLATGQEMGLSEDQLMKLGRCAMLHDAGKQFIPLSIINKSGKLTDEEFRIMKDHPVKGAQSIKSKAIGDSEIWGGVMFHHEKYNGKGYPKSLKKEEIPLFARIIAVADVYDAVTSYRSYRKPMHPSLAYEIICSEIETSFEYDIVKAFTNRLIVYPIGCVLELTDKRYGVVVDNEIKLRPIIKLAEGGEMLDLANVKNLTIGISNVINPNERGSEL